MVIIVWERVVSLLLYFSDIVVHYIYIYMMYCNRLEPVNQYLHFRNLNHFPSLAQTSWTRTRYQNFSPIVWENVTGAETTEDYTEEKKFSEGSCKENCVPLWEVVNRWLCHHVRWLRWWRRNFSRALGFEC
jgi:hypothetical protein